MYELRTVVYIGSSFQSTMLWNEIIDICGCYIYIAEKEYSLAYLRKAVPERRCLVLLEADETDDLDLRLIQSIKKDPLLKQLPVVALCDSAEPEIVDAFFKAGVADLIVKPVQRADLYDIIQTLKSYWGLCEWSAVS